MTFASGTTSNNDMLCLNIAIADDDAYEENELFTFLITSASSPSAVAIGASQAVKTIQDNNGIIVNSFLWFRLSLLNDNYSYFKFLNLALTYCYSYSLLYSFASLPSLPCCQELLYCRPLAIMI